MCLSPPSPPTHMFISNAGNVRYTLISMNYALSLSPFVTLPYVTLRNLGNFAAGPRNRNNFKLSLKFINDVFSSSSYPLTWPIFYHI